MKQDSYNMSSKHMTKEKVINLAKEFETKGAFKTANRSAYIYALKNNMLDDLFGYSGWANSHRKK